MKIQLDYTPELAIETIYKFVLAPTEYVFTSQEPAESGYYLAASRDAGEKIISLFVEVREYYNVLHRSSVISSFDVVIPIQQPVTLRIKSNLLIRNTVPNALASKIVLAFNNYDPKSGIDAIDYANQQLAREPQFTTDMFMVSASFQLDKHDEHGRIWPRKEYRNQLEVILAIYNGTDQNSQLDVLGDQKLGDYFKAKGYKAVLVRRENLLRPSNLPKDSLREIEQKKPADITSMISHIDNLVRQNSTGLQCDELETEKTRIVHVPIPEFKTEWGWKLVEIGCVKTHLYLPGKVYIRDNLKILYACAGHEKRLAAHFKQQIISCTTNSALAAGVIGIWLSSLGVALIAFKSLFFQCIKASIGEDIVCLFPELVVLTETTDWREL